MVTGSFLCIDIIENLHHFPSMRKKIENAVYIVDHMCYDWFTK